MKQPTVNNSEVRAEQAASKKHQTIKLGLDVHAESIVVARQLDQSTPQPPQKFTPAGFLAWVKTRWAWRTRSTPVTKQALLASGCTASLWPLVSRTWWRSRSAWMSSTRK